MKRQRVGPGVYKVWSERLGDFGYKANIRLGSRRVWLPTDGVYASDRQARDAIKEARAAYSKQEFLFPADRQEITVRTIFDKWIERLETRNVHPETVSMAKRTFAGFNQVLGLDSEYTKLASVHLGRYFTLRQVQGAKSATAYKELKQVMGAMAYAVGQIPGLESWKPPKKPAEVVQPESKRKREITLEEEELLLSDLRAHGETDMEHLLILGLDTGGRVQELFRIDRADVLDEPGKRTPYGTLVLRATKHKKYRLTGETIDRPVPMTRRAREIMDSRRGNWNPLTESPRAGPLFAKFDYRLKLAESCRRADIVYGRNTAGGMTFHDLRHTLASRLTRKGVSLLVIGLLLGQKKIATTSDYTHATAADLGGAIGALED